MRILDKKALTNEHPNSRIFKWLEVDMLLNGKHHEEEEIDDDDEIEQVEMNYLTRSETF